MMSTEPKCNLIIDSCCDLPPDLVKHDGVYLLEFPYILDGGQYNDDLFQTTTPKDFYAAMRNGAEPTTAQVSVPTIEKAFQWAVDSGLPTVYLSFTSGLSGSLDTAELIKSQMLEKYPDAELYVVDTLLASIAEGMLVYEALQQRANGMTAKELVAWVEEARFFVDDEFMVEDLNTLRRGGRIPATVAVAGAALDAKPLLTIDSDGKLSLSGVARGRKKGIKSLVDYYSKHAENTDDAQTIVIGNADCARDMQRLRDDILQINEHANIIECSIGPVIGSHVGPGMLAIVFWGDDRRESLSVANRIAKRIRGKK